MIGNQYYITFENTIYAITRQDDNQYLAILK